MRFLVYGFLSIIIYVQIFTLSAQEVLPESVPKSSLEAIAITEDTMNHMLSQNIKNNNDPLLFTADKIDRTQKGVITATGNVEIRQNNKILTAERIIYHQKDQTIKADGGVKLILQNGTIFFSDTLMIDSQLRDGIIKKIRMLLADDSRLTASQAVIQNNERVVLSKANYTPCQACQENPEKPPVWQIKADQIVHDKSHKRINYKNARLEIGGVPVFYSPFLTHPDPTVSRNSGFLMPSFGNNNNIGSFIRVPYYHVLSDYNDITIEPIFTDKIGPILAIDYNHVLFDSDIKIEASINQSDQNDINGHKIKDDDMRGHIFSTAKFEINDEFRWGGSFNRASDKYYLVNVGLWDIPTNFLKSDIYLEGFNTRNYFMMDARYYQDVRLSENKNSPFVLPNMYYQAIGESDDIGGRWDLTTYGRAFHESGNASSQTLSMKAGYQLPLMYDSGILTNIRGEMRGDVTNSNVNNSATNQDNDDMQVSLMPRFDVTASYPLIKQQDFGTLLVEPIVATYFATNVGNQTKKFNADSNIYSYDHTNIFDSNRYAGIDRIEGGQQLAYGIRGTESFDYGGEINFFAGQFYRIGQNQDLINETGLTNDRSDLVSRIEAKLIDDVVIDYSARFDESNYDVNRSQLGIDARINNTTFDGDYVFYNAGRNNSANDIEQYRFQITHHLDNVELGARYEGNLIIHETIRSQLFARYIIDCLVAGVTIKRDFTRVNNRGDNKTILFTLSLLNLGDVVKTDIRN